MGCVIPGGSVIPVLPLGCVIRAEDRSITHKSFQARFLHVLCSVPGPSGRSGPKSNMICPISLLLSFLYLVQPNDTESYMICVMRLLRVMFPGGNRLTQNLYDLFHAVVAIHFS